MVDAWSKCTDKVASEMMKGISATEKTDQGLNINSVFMMADLGAKRFCSSNEATSWDERFNSKTIR